LADNTGRQNYPPESTCWWCHDKNSTNLRIDKLENACERLGITLGRIDKDMAIISTKMVVFAAIGSILGSAIASTIIAFIVSHGGNAL
jgi:hypothetical protein